MVTTMMALHQRAAKGEIVTHTWSTDSFLHQIGYREKAREEASRGGSLAYRPDIALATEVSKLTSQVHRTKSTICLMKPWATFQLIS